jgi:hypothetical protein
MSWHGDEGLDEKWNIPLLALKAPGFPQDVLDCHAA